VRADPLTKDVTRPRDGAMRRPDRRVSDSEGFRDDRRSVWTLGEYLGGGSQGVVHRTQEAGYAIKLLTRADRSLERIRRLPISDLRISGPQTYLEEGRGYTMELASDMEPLAASLLPLDLQPIHDLAWYRETGGLAKRLSVAMTVAETLAALHARGLVYGDLQRHNVMVSKQPKNGWTLLIDADNIDFEGEPPTILGTPGFIPPEAQARTSRAELSQAQDRWALAVLVHWLLAANHPFVDQIARSRTPGSRHQGLPTPDRYVDAPGAEAHAAGPGASWALSPALREAARRSLMHGSEDPRLRVSAARWASLLRRARHHLVECRCGWTQYDRSMDCANCPRQMRSGPPFSVWTSDRACAPLASGRMPRRAALQLDRRDLASAENVTVTIRYRRDSGVTGLDARGCDPVDTGPRGKAGIDVVALRGPWHGERRIVIGPVS
jgi:serine/threonine protein kinase